MARKSPEYDGNQRFVNGKKPDSEVQGLSESLSKAMAGKGSLTSGQVNEVKKATKPDGNTA